MKLIISKEGHISLDKLGVMTSQNCPYMPPVIGRQEPQLVGRVGGVKPQSIMIGRCSVHCPKFQITRNSGSCDFLSLHICGSIFPLERKNIIDKRIKNKEKLKNAPAD